MAVHVIQSYPSNNLNRGEDGSPKSCIFGGVRRSRVSSQCIKRNARLAMYDVISENDEMAWAFAQRLCRPSSRDSLAAGPSQQKT